MGDELHVKQVFRNASLTYHWDISRALPVILWETGPREITLAEYTNGVDLLSLVEPRGLRREEPFYYLQDGLGSVAQVTDSQGQVKLDYTYDAFGDIRALSIGRDRIPRNLFDFTAQQRDVLSGMLYLRARYYEPTVGRFIARDPYPLQTRHPQTLHRFLYAFNNPFNFADPTGEQIAIELIGPPFILFLIIGGFYIYQTNPVFRERIDSGLQQILGNIGLRSWDRSRDPVLEQHEEMVARLLQSPSTIELIPGGGLPGPNHPFWWLLIPVGVGYFLRVVAESCKDAAEVLGLEAIGPCRAIQGLEQLPRK